ncbi:MAG: small multi-drug resistant family protein [Proteobacteria bacterium SG_bin5]|nr:MAG: small multi-drug resistant family protein [Proteobacteria bacterium SG_bin5]
MKLADLSLILLSVALSASGQLLLKLGASAPAVRGAIAGGAPIERALALLGTPALVGGLAVYALSAAAWIVVLSKLDLSLAYPFVGLGFVVTFLIGVLLLGEPASAGRLAGTLLIAGGAVLVARG